MNLKLKLAKITYVGAGTKKLKGKEGNKGKVKDKKE